MSTPPPPPWSDAAQHPPSPSTNIHVSALDGEKMNQNSAQASGVDTASKVTTHNGIAETAFMKESMDAALASIMSNPKMEFQEKMRAMHLAGFQAESQARAMKEPDYSKMFDPAYEKKCMQTEGSGWPRMTLSSPQVLPGNAVSPGTGPMFRPVQPDVQPAHRERMSLPLAQAPPVLDVNGVIREPLVDSPPPSASPKVTSGQAKTSSRAKKKKKKKNKKTAIKAKSGQPKKVSKKAGARRVLCRAFNKHKDVVMGRGGMSIHNPGNKRWREFIKDNISEYKATDKGGGRHKLSAEKVVALFRQEIGGEFVEFNEEKDTVDVVSDKDAVEKTRQKLSEELKKESNETDSKPAAKKRKTG